MKSPLLIVSTLYLLCSSPSLQAGVTYVTSQQEFDQAQSNAAMNDSIVWKSGTYSNIYMNISKDDLVITAESLGATIFTGSSRVNITGDHIVLRGFQFLDGNIGTSDVINIRGSNIVINEINIRAYTCYKYLRVREESQFVEITYCNFENRLNLDDQNILSILVDENQPGYHKIQHCSFKNFDGTGNDLGIEPIRIGLSSQADHISRTLVEYCYFTQCNGDGEIISSKATQNVYRFNTFEDNPKAELVLRHGSEAIVYGNFFLKGKGGVRVREGQDHYIYNNYFYELDDRTIYLQNASSDPLDNIHIAFNTIVDCDEIILGGDGSYKPTNVTFANNIFADPNERLFDEPTGTETWIGNISFGNLGMNLPMTGITNSDPRLVENSEGFFGLSEDSPAIDAAKLGYAILPQFEGMDTIDTEILFDLMGQTRSSVVEEKDLGCNEYPHEILVQPIATEDNTGPSYNTSVTTSVRDQVIMVQNLIQISPNPVRNLLNITAQSELKVRIQVYLSNAAGSRIDTLLIRPEFLGKTNISKEVGALPAGLYTITAASVDEQGVERVQSLKFIKSK